MEGVLGKTGVVVVLLLLAGCAAPSTMSEPGYACTRCVAVADDEPSRGHFENFLAASPADPNHLVVAACTFDGQRFQTTAHASFDQGQTWSVAQLPYGDRVPLDHPLATVNFAADPGVAISADGQTVIVSAVGLTSVPVEALSGNLPFQSIMFVARSDDGGRTFPPEGVTMLQGSVQAYPAVQDFSDHPRIVAGADGTFLVMWGSLDLPDPFSAQRFLATQDVVLATSLEVRFSASTDQGRTWSAPALAYRDTDLHYYPPSPVIRPDGSWLVMPSEYNGGEGDVYLSVSNDRGASWSWDATPMRVSAFGTSAVGPDGRLFFSFNEPQPDGTVWPRLAVAEGDAWNIIDLTDGPNTRRGLIENMLAVDGRGVAHVLYVWLPPGASEGEVRVASWTPDGTLHTTVLEAGLAPERNFGHYIGLAATPDGAVATWPLATTTAAAGAIWQTEAPLLTGMIESVGSA